MAVKHVLKKNWQKDNLFLSPFCFSNTHKKSLNNSLFRLFLFSGVPYQYPFRTLIQ
ncbi:MAG: hypothetical protein ACI884_002557 [Ulvibacter sp.]